MKDNLAEQVQIYVEFISDAIDKYFPVFVFILSASVVFCFIMVIRDCEKRYGLLIRHLSGRIKQNSDFYHAFYKACHNIAAETFTNNSCDFQSYEQSVLTYWKQFVFCENGRHKSVVKLSDDFCNWVCSCDTKYRMSDLCEAMTDYIKHTESQSCQQLQKLQEAKQLCDLQRSIAAAKEKADKKHRQIQKHQSVVLNREDFIKLHNSIVMSYNHCIKDIKDNGGHGLIPINPRCLSMELYRKLYFQPIYSDQHLRSVIQSDDNLLHFLGCYIMYNPYTDEYFVGSSTDVYATMLRMFNFVNTSSELYCNLHDGHMLLTKFISLSDSGFDDLNKLLDVLAQAYKATIISSV